MREEIEVILELMEDPDRQGISEEPEIKDFRVSVAVRVQMGPPGLLAVQGPQGSLARKGLRELPVCLALTGCLDPKVTEGLMVSLVLQVHQEA